MNQLGVPIINGFRLAATIVLSVLIPINANAHSGGVTRLELINPHSWI
jgi:hypothetical protein